MTNGKFTSELSQIATVDYGAEDHAFLIVLSMLTSLQLGQSDKIVFNVVNIMFKTFSDIRTPSSLLLLLSACKG